MTDQECFEKAIWENPAEEDTPRLVYADWLEERDDPEFAGWLRGGYGRAGVTRWKDSVRFGFKIVNSWTIHDSTEVGVESSTADDKPTITLRRACEISYWWTMMGATESQNPDATAFERQWAGLFAGAEYAELKQRCERQVALIYPQTILIDLIEKEVKIDTEATRQAMQKSSNPIRRFVSTLALKMSRKDKR